jgi:hypothetical protein
VTPPLESVFGLALNIWYAAPPPLPLPAPPLPLPLAVLFPVVEDEEVDAIVDVEVEEEDDDDDEDEEEEEDDDEEEDNDVGSLPLPFPLPRPAPDVVLDELGAFEVVVDVEEEDEGGTDDDVGVAFGLAFGFSSMMIGVFFLTGDFLMASKSSSESSSRMATFRRVVAVLAGGEASWL